MFTAISREELRAAIDAGSVTVVDVLPPATYAKHHLPGAINIAGDNSDEQLRAVLPERDVPIVIYSANHGCTRTTDLAARLGELGYVDVRPYPGGLEDWLAAGLPMESANADRGALAGDMVSARLIVLPDGPYEVAGPLEIRRLDDAPIPAPDPVYLCRCGRSANKPFCDGAHARTGWKEDA